MADMIPVNVPLIVEAVIEESRIEAEIERVREAFPVHTLVSAEGVVPGNPVGSWLLCQPT
jgi:type 1 glutamine amidotransferase